MYTTGNLLSVMWQPGWEGRFGEECMYACSVILLYLTLCDPMDYSPPGSSVHGIFPARILEWVAISSSKGSSPHRDQTQVSCIARQILYH